MGMFRRHSVINVMRQKNPSIHASSISKTDFHWRPDRIDKRYLERIDTTIGHDRLIIDTYGRRSASVTEAIKLILTKKISSLQKKGFKNMFECRPYAGIPSIKTRLSSKSIRAAHVVSSSGFHHYLRE